MLYLLFAASLPIAMFRADAPRFRQLPRRQL